MIAAKPLLARQRRAQRLTFSIDLLHLEFVLVLNRQSIRAECLDHHTFLLLIAGGYFAMIKNLISRMSC